MLKKKKMVIGQLQEAGSIDHKKKIIQMRNNNKAQTTD